VEQAFRQILTGGKWVCIFMYLCCLCMYVFMCVCMYGWMDVCMCIYVCMCVYVFVYKCVCVFLFVKNLSYSRKEDLNEKVLQREEVSY
jgi:hypothetical protein